MLLDLAAKIQNRAKMKQRGKTQTDLYSGTSLKGLNKQYEDNIHKCEYNNITIKWAK